MNVLQCPSCQHIVSHEQKFCGNCGLEIENELINCKKCSHQNFAQSTYCIQCGHNLTLSPFRIGVIFRVIGILLVIIGSTVYMFRDTFDQHFGSNTTNTDLVSSNTQQKKQEKVVETEYREISFSTLGFSGETSHEVEIAVSGPTNKAFMIDAFQAFLQKNTKKIAPKDIVICDIYEEIPQEGLTQFRGTFLSYNETMHENYEREGDYQKIETNIYVQWDATARAKDSLFDW